MMYNKIILSSLVISLNTMAMNDQEIIPRASYAAPKDQHDSMISATKPDTTLTFYTFDGTPLKDMPYTKNYTPMLDPNAPRPQPASYAIKPRQGTSIKDSGHLGLVSALLKQKISGNVIIFYDINGKIINSYSYNQKTISLIDKNGTAQQYDVVNTEALKNFPLDLSMLDFSKVHSAQ